MGGAITATDTDTTAMAMATRRHAMGFKPTDKTPFELGWAAFQQTATAYVRNPFQPGDDREEWERGWKRARAFWLIKNKETTP